jgi:hypothetical protein
VRVYYKRYLADAILKLKHDADVAHRTIEKIVLTKTEGHQLEWELSQVLCGFDSNKLYGIVVEIEGS